MKPIVVIGAGGHALVVADALIAAGAEVIGFTDADASKRDLRPCGLPVLGEDAAVLAGYRPDAVLLANGIGGIKNTDVRRSLQMRLEAQGWNFATVKHPSAIVSPNAHLGDGVQLMAGSIVQPAAVIGTGSIINTGAIIEHDVHVGDYVHIAPRAVLCGFVKVDSCSHIGAGAVVRQSVQLGRNTLVGAGAVVVRDFGGNGRLLGVPAQQGTEHLS